MKFRVLLTAAAALAALAACSSQSSQSKAPATQVMDARDQLVAEVRQCTATHDYDPDATAGIAENALAPQELPWRQCAYDAVRRYAKSHPSLSGMYDQVIAEDISMTAAIQQGTLTRSARRARIEELLAQIKQAEEAQIEATEVEQSRQNDQLRNVVDNMRGFGY